MEVMPTPVEPPTDTAKTPSPSPPDPSPATPDTAPPTEIGGPKGPEPTRYGDWEIGGRCSDF